MQNLFKKSKRSILKVRKQRLCERINQCKSLKELKGWEKTFSYHSVLKEDFDWDYCYFFDLIEFKLKRMANYFHTHNIVQNEKYYGDLCEKAIAILRAGYKTEIITQEDLGNIYVNDRNIKRFFTPHQIEFLQNENLKQYYLPNLREYKAKRLFWKFLDRYIELLWD